LYCPNLAVQEGTSRVTVFAAGAEGDAGAAIAAARVTGVAGSCRMIPGEFGLRITVRASFEATGGAAYDGGPVVLPYYVAIVDGTQVVEKQLYTITLNPGAGGTAVMPPVIVETPDFRATAKEEILVGFQLSPEQLAYAQANPGG
jgi:hypothetical protein